MKYVPFSFTSKDELTLQGRAWLSQKINPEGTIYLIHDLGEHSARYTEVGEFFSEEGFHFVGFDLRGHGLSEGEPGHYSKFTDLINDVERLICQSTKHFGFSKDQRILYGQGIGGNLAMNYLLKRKPYISGAIITSPILNTPLTKTKFQRTWLHFITSIFPKMKFRNRIKAEDLSRDLAYVKAYQHDVYNHNKIFAHLTLDIYRNGKYAMANIDKLDIPVLLMHGTSNRVTPISVSKAIAEKAGNMVDIILWENGYHELHNDIQKELVIRRIIEWLRKEIKS